MTRSLEQALEPKEERKAKLVNLLQTWLDEEDAQEQNETGNYLIQVLDDDRLSNRKTLSIRARGCNLVDRVVLLDAGILGLVTNPKRSQQVVFHMF